MITLRELLAKMQNPKFIMSKDKEMGWLRDSEKKDLREFQSDDESDTDPYEDEDISSEERENGEIN